jgi:uncharacterized OsmC-like protein
MDERVFHLRSRASHDEESNDLVQLELEIEVDGGWQPLAMTAEMPPFRAFVCAALMCQHAYLRMHASEMDLVLREARGELWMKTADWFVTEITASFQLEIEGEYPSTEDLAFISERMRDCPISRNLSGAVKATTLQVIELEVYQGTLASSR